MYYSRGPLLIKLNHGDSAYLTFDADNLSTATTEQFLPGELRNDPIQVFAASAYAMNVPILTSNRHFYGYVIDASPNNGWPEEREHKAIVAFINKNSFE